MSAEAQDVAVNATHAILPILRRFNDAFIRPEGFAWREAYAVAAMTWGASRGLAIAHAGQDFLSALMLSRSVPLRMADIDAPLRPVGADETAMVGLLEAMQADDTPRARDLIALVTAGRVEAAVIRTGLALAQRLDPIAPPPSTQARPALSVVG